MKTLPFLVAFASCLALSPMVQGAETETSSDKTTFVAKPATVPEGMRPLSTGKFIASGIVGTAAGFGIGHMVQGTWRSGGWIFTVAEVGLLVLSQALVLDASKDGETVYDQRYLATQAGTIGFRVWEIIDIWSGPIKIDGQRYIQTSSTLQVLPAVAANGKPQALLAYGYRF